MNYKRRKQKLKSSDNITESGKIYEMIGLDVGDQWDDAAGWREIPVTARGRPTYNNDSDQVSQVRWSDYTVLHSVVPLLAKGRATQQSLTQLTFTLSHVLMLALAGKPG